MTGLTVSKAAARPLTAFLWGDWRKLGALVDANVTAKDLLAQCAGPLVADALEQWVAGRSDWDVLSVADVRAYVAELRGGAK